MASHPEAFNSLQVPSEIESDPLLSLAVLKEDDWLSEEGHWPGRPIGTSVWDPDFNEHSQARGIFVEPSCQHEKHQHDVNAI